MRYRGDHGDDWLPVPVHPMHRPLNPDFRAPPARSPFFAAHLALCPDRTVTDPGTQRRPMARLIRVAARMFPAR